LEKQSADNVVSGANEPFSPFILWRSVRAGKSQGDAVSGKQMSKGRGEKLAAVVTLHASDCGVKLCGDKGEKSLESVTGI
jgi:hypothetical protein